MGVATSGNRDPLGQETHCPKNVYYEFFEWTGQL